jgi:hypothetical protein
MYGLEPFQVVSSFAGAVSGDFAVAPMGGYEVIEQEIEFQWQKLKMAMSNKLKNKLDQVSFEVPFISGGVTFVPGLYAIEDTLEVWKVDRCAKICGPDSFRNTCETGFCGGSVDGISQIDPWIKKLEVTTDYTSIGNNIYDLVIPIDIDEYYLVISYKVDESNLNVTSLSSILRDMVCANLGNRLFATTEGEAWSIVKHYAEQADKWIELLNSGWVPSEISKMKLLFNSPIRSLKVARS